MSALYTAARPGSSTSLLDSMWGPERAALRAELAEANAISLYAAEAEDAVAVLDQVLAADKIAPVVRVDMGRASLPGRVVFQLARQSVRALADGADLLDLIPEARSGEDTRRLLDIRRALGPAFAVLDEEDEVDEPLVIAACLDAVSVYARTLGRRAILVLIGAERALVDKNLMELLWQVRGTTQRNHELNVVFCGGPGVPGLTSEPKAAFQGWGVEITLRADPKVVADLVGRRLRTVQTPEEADRTARRIADWSGSSLAVAEQLTTQMIVHILGREPIDVSDVWEDLLRQAGPRLRPLAATTAEISAQSLPVAITIAKGGQPYKTPGAYDTAVRRALTGLGAAGITERTGPRSWRIVDPLFAAWLRAD